MIEMCVGGRRTMIRRFSKYRKGFTLVELSLSVAFVGLLAVTIALLVNDSIKNYRRGVTLNQINTVGMDLVDDMRSAIQNSSARSLEDRCGMFFSTGTAEMSRCMADGGIGMTFVQYTGEMLVRGTAKVVPKYGVFCTGSYSYLWNTGYYYDNYAESGVRPAKFMYKASTGDKTIENYRLLKVADVSRSVCMAVLKDSSKAANGEFDVRGYDVANGEDPVELLAGRGDGRDINESDTNLALYNLEVVAPAESEAANSLFYTVSFILGTIQGGADVTATNDLCETPEDYEDEEFDYCAINKFNFAAQATGE